MRDFRRSTFSTLALALNLTLLGAPAQAATETVEALLVDDFVTALETYAAGLETLPAAPGIRLWLDGLSARDVPASFVAARLAKAKAKHDLENADPFRRYRLLQVEALPEPSANEAIVPEVALHAFRLDVVEDYDDVYNDDMYCYFITTHDDLVWGKVTSIYTGLDEGSAVFFSPTDRGLFGPLGEKLTPQNHTLVDFGLVESDSSDIRQLQQLSDAMIDLALVALTSHDGQAGAAAAQARAEVQNLLRLVIEMDDDDRLVTDTLRFTPAGMAADLAGSSVHELSRFYEREDFWTHFAYRVHFRLLR